jgi:hypothetical protein
MFTKFPLRSGMTYSFEFGNHIIPQRQLEELRVAQDECTNRTATRIAKTVQ